MAESADQTLQILIKAVADTTGFTMTQEQAAKLNATLATGGDATKDLGKKTEEAGESVKLFNVHGREMHRLIGEAERISPGLGVALKAAFNPENIGIFAAVVALTEFVKWLNEAERSANEIEDKLADTSTAMWDAQVTAIGSVRKAIADTSRDIDKMLDTKQVKNYYDLQKTLLDARMEQEKKLLDVIEKNELAGAGGDKTAEERIKLRFDALRQQTDFKKQGGEITIKEDQAAQEEVLGHNARADLKGAEANLTARQPALDADLKNRTDDKAEADKALTAATKEAARTQEAFAEESEYPQDGLLDAYKKTAEHAQEALEIAKARVADDQHVIDVESAAKQGLIDAINELKDKVKAHATAHEELTAELNASKGVLSIEKVGAAQQQAIETFNALNSFIASLHGSFAGIADALISLKSKMGG